MTPDNATHAERLRAVATHIRNHEDRFDMEIIFDGPQFETNFKAQRNRTPLVDIAMAMQHGACQTTACIAGWALALYPEEIPSDAVFADWDTVASRILGLPMTLTIDSRSEVDDGLFYADSTAIDAAKRLENLADQLDANTRPEDLR